MLSVRSHAVDTLKGTREVLQCALTALPDTCQKSTKSHAAKKSIHKSRKCKSVRAEKFADGIVQALYFWSATF